MTEFTKKKDELLETTANFVNEYEEVLSDFFYGASAKKSELVNLKDRIFSLEKDVKYISNKLNNLESLLKRSGLW